jgi:hypothetical protein
MADDLKTEKQGLDALEPRVEREQTLARVQGVPWLVVIVLLALCAWLGWKAFGPDDRNGDPIATTLVAFEEQNALTVFSAQLSPVVSAESSSLFGAIKNRQVAVIPARVDYSLDLSRMDARRMSWDGESETLTVQLPPLRIGTPNLDEGEAQYLREGVWISRDAQDKLTRANTRLAEQQAIDAATNPTLLKLARDAGRSAIAQNLAIPLQVAGFGEVKVVVTYDDDRPAK